MPTRTVSAKIEETAQRHCPDRISFMTPDQLLRTIEKKSPAPVYLFVGPETWRRRGCRDTIVDKMLGEETDRSESLIIHDLDEVSMAEVLDDARSMSLFAATRVLVVNSAESALPRGRAATADADDGGGKEGGGAELLKSYCADPTPGVVLIFDARRYDFDGEDKAKMDRLRKFYAPISEVVEFTRLTLADAREFAQQEAARRQLRFAPGALEQLVEATGPDPSRMVNEIEKLSLFASTESRPVTSADIASLTPNASETTIFGLVQALAKRDRAAAMSQLDTLVREGEYLPLALTFLGGIFRMALVAREQSLRSSQDVQSFFQRQGVAMWRSRAEQIHLAGSRFSKDKLEQAIHLTFTTDKSMKGSRPDDRIVMEDFIIQLTQ